MPKTVHTKVDDITFAIPQVREGGFYPEALEKGTHSERALKLAVEEYQKSAARLAEWDGG
jgi:putative transposase